MEEQLVHVREIVSQHGSRQSELIAILQEIQNEYKYLSEGALVTVAEMLHVSPAHVYSVATFYENFSLEAKGEAHHQGLCGDGMSCPQVPAHLRRHL